MDKYISDVETSRFGIKVARINSFEDSPSALLAKLKMADFKLVISRIPVSNLELINEMESIGFQIKDVQVTHNFDLKKEPIVLCGDVELGNKFHQEDTDVVAEIARRSFKNYGHYSRCELTCSFDTGEIYADWAKNCCENKSLADHTVVARVKGRVVGFLCLKIKELAGEKYVSGVMGAVDDNYWKKGIFKKINLAGLKWAWDNNLARVEHNVLVTNIAVNKVYSNLGFHIIRSEVTLYWKG